MFRAARFALLWLDFATGERDRKLRSLATKQGERGCSGPNRAETNRNFTPNVFRGKVDDKGVTPNSEQAVSEAAVPNTPSAGTMDRSLAKNLTWRAGGDWFGQLLSWTSLLIVVRLLTPADFGIAAMAVILLPYLRYVGEFGIPRTILNLRELNDSQIAQLNTVGAILGTSCFICAALLARPFAMFFHTPALAAVVTVTCLTLVPEGFRAVSEGLLVKEMRFPLLSLFDASRAIVAAIATLTFAFFHFGYWSLVWGNLLGTVCRSVLVFSFRPHRFARPRLASIGHALRFGGHITVSMVALNSYQQLDNLTAGRVLGQSALGFYGMAWTLANVPIEKVTSLVTTVIPSYLAAFQSDKAALRRYLSMLTEAIALLTFPATIGVGLVAPQFVPLVLGQKWNGMIVPLEILSFYAGFRSVIALMPKVLTAVGNPRFVMWNDLAALFIMPVAFFLGSHWGTGGIAMGWVIAYPLVVVPLCRKTFRSIDMNSKEYIRALRPAFDGVVVMAAFVLALKRMWHPEHLLPLLSAEIAVGAAAYLTTLLLFHRQRVLVFTRFIKKLPSHRT